MKLETNPEKWIVLEEIDSTNDFALGNKNLSSGSVIIAKNQTKGKGRMGRRWLSVPGDSFLFTGLLHMNTSHFPAEKLKYISLVSGLSVIRAAGLIFNEPGRQKYPDGDLHSSELFIKWPNDVYMTRGGRTGKLAGMLIETEFIDGENFHCAVGIGMNWRGASPFLTDEKVGSISLFPETGKEALEFALPLIQNFNNLMENLFSTGAGEIVSEIRKHFYLKDKLISLSGKRYTVAGMNDEGGLVLESADGEAESRVLYDTSEKIHIENM